MPQSFFFSVATSLTQPLLDGFRLEGQLEAANGKQLELMKLYCQSILAAFGDVEIALIAIADGAERERLQRLVVIASRQAFEISETQAARGHARPRHRATDPADLVHGRRPARAGAPCPVAGGVEPLSGARRKLAPAGSGGASKARAMTAKRRTIVILLSCLVVGGVAALYYSNWPQQVVQQQFSKRKGGGPVAPGTEAVPVLAVEAKLADVPVYLDGVGTARALNTVTVRAQVDGKLLKIMFTEGQDVKKGYVLAKIDPTIYQAQYDQAVAKKAQDEATLANARLDLERYTRLSTTNAINKQQLDTQKALVAQLEAQVKSDQAAIENAKAMLSYTDVVAPIAGRTGIRLIDEGNLVQGVRHHRHRRHHAAAADLGVLQPAAAGVAGHQQGPAPKVS